MNARRRHKSTGPFLAVPQYVLRSPQFRTLSPPACKLLFAVGGEFRGDNNGELEMPFGERGAGLLLAGKMPDAACFMREEQP